MQIDFLRTSPRCLRHAALGIAAAAMLLACGNAQEGSSPAGFAGFGGFGGGSSALPVVTETVRIGTVSNFLVATTTLSAEKALDVVSRAAGPVATVLVEEGDAVTAGELLATIEADDASLALREAQTHFDNSRRSYDRTVSLAERNAVSNEDVEKQRYDLEIREYALLRAQQQLQNTQIRSPIDGVVATRNAQAGANISANTALFRVVDLDRLLAVIHIPEVSRSQLRPGQQVTVSTEGGIDARGLVALISPVVDATSGTVKVTITVPGRRGLLPGIFVTVRVPVETHTDVMVIPKRAVLIERDQNVVYRLSAGGGGGEGEGASAAVRSPVELGLAAGDVVEIVAGLTAGDRVVIVGQESLRDGMVIREAGEPVDLAVANSADGADGAIPTSAAADSASVTAAPGDAGERGQARGEAGAATAGSASAAAGQSGRARGGGGGGFNIDFSEMPEEQRLQFEARLLENDQVKAAYDKQLEEDPELAGDVAKRATFFSKQLEEIGGPRALFAGGGPASGRGGARSGGG
jgi:membrane fusion protein (multidrug efflux system)